MERRLAFPHGKALGYGRVTAFLVILLPIAVVLAFAPPLSIEVAAAAVTVLGSVFVLFCVSPLASEHWLLRSRIILRQGWYFRAVIPFSDVRLLESAEDLAAHRVPLGVHRPLGRRTLFVTAGRAGLVRMELARPRRFLQAFGLLASQIVFDVTDPSTFLSAFEERRALFPPIEANRPDSDLRD